MVNLSIEFKSWNERVSSVNLYLHDVLRSNVYVLPCLTSGHVKSDKRRHSLLPLLRQQTHVALTRLPNQQCKRLNFLNNKAHPLPLILPHTNQTSNHLISTSSFSSHRRLVRCSTTHTHSATHQEVAHNGHTQRSQAVQQRPAPAHVRHKVSNAPTEQANSLQYPLQRLQDPEEAGPVLCQPPRRPAEADHHGQEEQEGF